MGQPFDPGGVGGGFVVAVASFRSTALLDACLASLAGEVSEAGGVVVVARRGPAGELDGARARWPEVRFLRAPDTAGIPELRGLALAEAAGRPALLTEDHCVVSPGWVARLLAGLETGAEVIGGAMGNARVRRAVDWGAYFAEYGFFGPHAGRPGSPAPSPTGANVAYAGSLVPRVSEAFLEGLWENVVHDRLRAEGRRFVFDAEAMVRQNAEYTSGAFMVDRFEHGRAYARRRLADAEGPFARLRYALATPLLTPVLLGRVYGAAGSAHRAAFARALGPCTAFLAAWAAGEFVGYLEGREDG